MHAIHTDLWVFEVEGDDLNAQEVVDVLLAWLDGEVEVKKIVEGDSYRRNEVDEHTGQLALRRRVKSQIHRHTLAPVELMTFVAVTQPADKWPSLPLLLPSVTFASQVLGKP